MNCDITAKTDGTWPKTSVSLNGHKLTIEGDLIFESGVLELQNGELDVTGNFCIEESDGDASSGILSMTHEKDIVRVGGMFRTYSAGDHSEYLTAGTLYVAGDFYEKSNGYWGSPGNARLNYAASEGHKTVLNGSGQQTVSFESEKSHFGTFEATNTDLVFSGYFSWKKMNCDITAKTDGTWLKTSVSLNGHKLTIEGDLIFRSGVLNIDGGELDVTGDFRITDPGSRSGVSNGILSMTHENDVVRVEGTFRMFSGNDHSEYLTAGTLYVAGDFYQVSQGYSGTSCNYAASEGHKTVLNGSGQQIVSFEREESHFGTLIIKRPIDQYQFKPNPCWITLVPDSASLFATADFSLPRALTGIEEASFEGVTAEIVFIPDDCETIEANAFQNSSVKWIRIPKDCVLGEDVFAGCEKVYIYSVAGSNAEDYCRSHENCIFIEE